MDVGIIGGADGPTSIFVSSTTHWGLIIGAAVVVAGCIAALVIWRKSRQKR
jgi:Na+-transporting methylmalonyl-CoA/oxaloacetate decarboxylase beta subunit